MDQLCGEELLQRGLEFCSQVKWAGKVGESSKNYGPVQLRQWVLGRGRLQRAEQKEVRSQGFALE